MSGSRGGGGEEDIPNVEAAVNQELTHFSLAKLASSPCPVPS